jgi:hypothetical protein
MFKASLTLKCISNDSDTTTTTLAVATQPPIPTPNASRSDQSDVTDADYPISTVFSDDVSSDLPTDVSIHGL